MKIRSCSTLILITHTILTSAHKAPLANLTAIEHRLTALAQEQQQALAAQDRQRNEEREQSQNALRQQKQQLLRSKVLVQFKIASLKDKYHASKKQITILKLAYYCLGIVLTTILFK